MVGLRVRATGRASVGRPLRLNIGPIGLGSIVSAAAVTANERVAPFDGNQWDEEQTEVGIDARHIGLPQSAAGADPRLRIDASGSGLNAADENAHIQHRSIDSSRCEFSAPKTRCKVKPDGISAGWTWPIAAIARQSRET